MDEDGPLGKKGFFLGICIPFPNQMQGWSSSDEGEEVTPPGGKAVFFSHLAAAGGNGHFICLLGFRMCPGRNHVHVITED